MTRRCLQALLQKGSNLFDLSLGGTIHNCRTAWGTGLVGRGRRQQQFLDQGFHGRPDPLFGEHSNDKIGPIKGLETCHEIVWGHVQGFYDILLNPWYRRGGQCHDGNLAQDGMRSNGSSCPSIVGSEIVSPVAVYKCA